MKLILVLTLLLLLAACVSSTERHEALVRDLAPVGADAKSVSKALIENGYKCDDSERHAVVAKNEPAPAQDAGFFSCSRSGGGSWPPIGCNHVVSVEYARSSGRVVTVRAPSACTSF